MLNSFGPLFVILWLSLTTQWSESPKETLQSFESDLEFVQEKILSPLETASDQIASASCLYKWVGFKDYLDLCEQIEHLQACHSRESLESRIAHRVNSLKSGDENWIGWLDAALLARAGRRYDQALDCLDEVIQSEGYADDPTIRVLRGRTLLDLRRVSAATTEYEVAVQLALQSENPGLVFRVRNAYCDDLFKHNRIDLSIRKGLEFSQSEYPIEKAWLHSLKIVYAWSQGDREGCEEALEMVAGLIPSVTYSPSSAWERKRYDQIQEIVGISRSALAGDALNQMILTVESADFLYRQWNIQRVTEMLEPFTAAFPLEGYGQYSRLIQEWVVWTHYNYYASLSLRGEQEAAAQGFQSIIDTVPFEDQPGRIVDAHCWLGRTYKERGFFRESIAAFETGLVLDVADAQVAQTVGLPISPNQPIVFQGKTDSSQREGYVRLFECAQRLLTDSEGGVE